jgi:hypothetical protein
MTKDDFVVGGLALLMVVSTLFNATNAQAAKKEGIRANLTHKHHEKIQECQIFK